MHQKYYEMKYLLTMICLWAAFSSCGSDHDDEPDITPKGRTVLMYVSAENTLNDFFDTNLAMMVKGAQSLSKDDHLIAFVDRASTTEMPYIAEITDGTITKVKEFATDITASDPREMRDIIKWTAANYPAQDYGLVLWGHASGWLIEDSVTTRSGGPKRAFGIDNGTNSPGSDRGKWMNTPSMAKYITETGIKFKFIFADICCFQCVENAYELRNATEWLIGSPAEIPAYGAPYDAVVPHFFSRSTDFYKGIIDEYEKAYANQQYGGTTYSVPLSAVRTADMEPLAQAARQMWTAMPQPWPSADGVIYYFGRYTPAGTGYDRNPIFYDALDIVKANTPETVASEWQRALSNTVAYSSFNTSREWMSAGHVNFNAFTLDSRRMAVISMFVPLECYESGGANYNTMISHMAWHTASGLASVYR